MDKKKVFCPVSLPPPYHGSNIVTENVINNQKIRQEFDLDVLPISYNEDTENIGKLQFKKILLIIKYFIKIIIKSFNEYDLVYVVPAVKGIAFYRDFFLLLPLRLFQNNIVIHLHGKGVNKYASRNRFNKLLYRLFFQNTSVICLSEKLTYDIDNVHDGDIYIVNNGVKKIDYPAQVTSNRIPVILFLSNFVKSKGIFILLQAANILKEQNVSFKLNLVGAPRGNILQDINKKIGKFDLGSHVISIGPKYGSEKKEAFKNADIFVFPTYYDKEAFPLVISEAMNASLPVISTNNASIPNIIDDGETGFIINQRDPVALAEKMKLLIKDKDLRREMGKKGRDKFLENYTFEKFEGNLIKVFKKTINKCSN